MNTYLVSYAWKIFWRRGFGMATLTSSLSMETEEGLLDVQNAIKNRHRFRGCVILYFKKLGEGDV